MPIRESLLAVMVSVIWGMNFVAIDEGLGEMPPLLFLVIRFVVVLLPAIFLLPKPDVPWRTLAAAGLFLCVGQFGLLYTALALDMPAGLASLVLQAQVIFTVILAAAQLGERPTGRQIAGVMVGAAGLAVVATGRSAETPLLALMLTVAAAFSWATGNIVMRRAQVKSGLSMTVWSALFVPLPLLALSLVIDGPARIGHALTHITLANVLSTAYTAYLASLVGYGIWNTLLARYAAAKVVPFTLLVPVVGLLTAWIVQHEEPGPAELAGGVVLLLGVAITAIQWRRPPRPPTEPDPAMIAVSARAFATSTRKSPGRPSDHGGSAGLS